MRGNDYGCQGSRQTVPVFAEPPKPDYRKLVEYRVKAWLATFPKYVVSTSKEPEQYFQKMTGYTQEDLKSEWDTGSKLTTCNLFVGRYSLSVLKDKLTFGVFAFDLELTAAKLGIPSAWKTDGVNDHPKVGDVVRWKKYVGGVRDGKPRYHVGVCTGFEGGQIMTVEAGQGGRTSGYDAIKRFKKLYIPGRISGMARRCNGSRTRSPKIKGRETKSASRESLEKQPTFSTANRFSNVARLSPRRTVTA